MEQPTDADLVEDLEALKFGPDFSSAACLSNSEVAILLSHRQKQLEIDTGEAELNSVLLKTLEYVQRFSHYKNEDAVREVRRLLKSKHFHEYEMAALTNLCPAKAEEAKSLIPSLRERYDDDELQTVLTELLKYKESNV